MSGFGVDESYLLSVLQSLISIESINPSLVQGGSGESKIAHQIGDYLDRIGLEVDYQEIDEGRENVIGVLRGGGAGRTLMLNGHTDTVSITGMDIEPLEPVFRDGLVYGRGAFDMKGSLAAMLAAAKELVMSKARLNGDVVFAFVADEEYASVGTEEVIKEYSTDAAIVTEPTGLQLIIAHRGYAWAKVEVRGKAAHGSLFDVGVDAITKAGKVLVALDELEGKFQTQSRHPLLGRPSVHASLIQGGTELSTYPDYCRIELERRTLPDEDYHTIEAELNRLVSDVASSDRQFDASSEVFFYRPGLEISEDIEIVNHLTNACQTVTGTRPELIGARWWTDAALLSRAEIPAVLFGPSGDGAHSPVESVDFESLKTTARVLAEVTSSFCG
ncbi:MAG: ArgE/DapE family deacylase [Candidatus Thorarchaeota archaeon]|nr:MAG: ArgE/DapE family deacylase [Candidatus Thorarchaeota archaeon]